MQSADQLRVRLEEVPATELSCAVKSDKRLVLQLRIRARKLQRAGDLVADARKVLADVPKAKADL